MIAGATAATVLVEVDNLPEGGFAFEGCLPRGLHSFRLRTYSSRESISKAEGNRGVSRRRGASPAPPPRAGADYRRRRSARPLPATPRPQWIRLQGQHGRRES